MGTLIAQNQLDIYAETVVDLKSKDLPIGATVHTKGYYTAGDGGQATYLIAPSQVVDGLGDHTLANGNVAKLLSDEVNVLQYGAQRAAGRSQVDIDSIIDSVDILEHCLQVGETKQVQVKIDGIFKVSRTFQLTRVLVDGGLETRKLKVVGDTQIVGTGSFSIVELGHDIDIDALTIYTGTLTYFSGKAGLWCGFSYRNRIGTLRIDGLFNPSGNALGIGGEYLFLTHIDYILIAGCNTAIELPTRGLSESQGQVNAVTINNMEVFACKKRTGYLANLKCVDIGVLTIEDSDATDTGNGVFEFNGPIYASQIGSLYLEDNAITSVLFGALSDVVSPAPNEFLDVLRIGHIYHSTDSVAATYPAIKINKSGLVIDNAHIKQLSGPWIEVLSANANGYLHNYGVSGAVSAGVSFPANSQFLFLAGKQHHVQEWPDLRQGRDNPTTAGYVGAGGTFFVYDVSENAESVDFYVTGDENSALVPIPSYLVGKIFDVGAFEDVVEIKKVTSGNYEIVASYDKGTRRLTVSAGAASPVNWRVNVFITENLYKNTTR